MRLKTLCAWIGIALEVVSTGCRQPSAQNGALVYRHNCARCHIEHEGQASPAPVLTGYFYRTSPPDLRKVRAVIQNGLRSMPPFGGRLSSREVDDVIAYLKTLR